MRQGPRDIGYGCEFIIYAQWEYSNMNIWLQIIYKRSNYFSTDHFKKIRKRKGAFVRRIYERDREWKKEYNKALDDLLNNTLRIIWGNTKSMCQFGNYENKSRIKTEMKMKYFLKLIMRYRLTVATKLRQPLKILLIQLRSQRVNKRPQLLDRSMMVMMIIMSMTMMTIMTVMMKIMMITSTMVTLTTTTMMMRNGRRKIGLLCQLNSSRFTVISGCTVKTPINRWIKINW
jgi:hypothetical protein